MLPETHYAARYMLSMPYTETPPIITTYRAQPPPTPNAFPEKPTKEKGTGTFSATDFLSNYLANI
ncbi:MAG TPA: hypothetical protein VK152_08300 [Paludibacter sp.]|nr:hypothetical protein [Paludibacter sp.]